jgi:hypothetical protein
MAARFVLRLALFSGCALAASSLSACGSDDAGLPPDPEDELSLDDFLPEVPEPTGEPQRVWAGEITTANAEELVPGPAATAMPGDYFIRNARARFMLGAPTRVVGVIPQGGNIIGAVPLDDDGEIIVGDHFGELSFAYLLGRTCEPDSLEVIHDGSGGGAAVVRARGKAEPNDYINMRGIGALNVPRSLNPDIEDDVTCAVTYVLEPDSPSLKVQWTLFNPGEGAIRGPFASIVDTGGNIEGFSPLSGFERLGLDALTSPGDAASVPYVVYQGPGVSYGALPAHEDPNTPNAHLLVAGVSVLLFNGESFLDLLNRDAFYLELPAQSGVTHGLTFMVGRDAADVEAAFLRGRGVETATLTGHVGWATAGEPAAGARVGIYEDHSGTGAITAEDPIRTFTDVDDSGAFAVELAPGNYLVRAEVLDTARSETISVSLSASDEEQVSFELADPVVFDFTVTDGATGDAIPAKITVIGEHPARPDGLMFDAYDRVGQVVRMQKAIRGTSVIGADVDEPLMLPAGPTYKVMATRGTEWSYDSVVIETEPGQERGELEFVLWRVADPVGYVSSEYHVHAIGSPDSPVPEDVRVATAVVDGVEVFAQTDHDFVADLQPVVEELGLARFVRAIPGLEITPFVYGHINAFPIEPDPNLPGGGAIDWGRGPGGFAMLPGEIFEAARERGAEVVQVNHPRSSTGIANFMHYFDRAGLSFDYERRIIEGDPTVQPVPNEWLRLPSEASLWSDGFDAVEIWNGFDIADTNDDGVRELTRLELVMSDWFNFLSFGLEVTPIGSSDTHTVDKDPMGMPRTYVRVSDDSPAALESGRVVDDVLATISGTGARRDVVVTNGPHIEVTLPGETDSLLGAEVEAESGEITLRIRAIAPSWAHLDTIEIFANATPPIGNAAGQLQPLACFTSRDAPSVPCSAAAIFDFDANLVSEVEFEHEGQGTGVTYFEIEREITLAASQIDTREGAVSEDAWVVVRVRGNRGIFPVFLNGILTAGNLGTFLSGSDEDKAAILEQRGAPAMAVAAPIFVIFEGSEYRAPFAP